MLVVGWLAPAFGPGCLHWKPGAGVNRSSRPVILPRHLANPSLTHPSHTSRFTLHASLGNLQQLLHQREHVVDACRRIETHRRGRLNQMSDANLSQPDGVFAYLIR